MTVHTEHYDNLEVVLQDYPVLAALPDENKAALWQVLDKGQKLSPPPQFTLDQVNQLIPQIKPLAKTIETYLQPAHSGDLEILFGEADHIAKHYSLSLDTDEQKRNFWVKHFSAIRIYQSEPNIRNQLREKAIIHRLATEIILQPTPELSQAKENLDSLIEMASMGVADLKFKDLAVNGHFKGRFLIAHFNLEPSQIQRGRYSKVLACLVPTLDDEALFWHHGSDICDDNQPIHEPRVIADHIVR